MPDAGFAKQLFVYEVAYFSQTVLWVRHLNTFLHHVHLEADTDLEQKFLLNMGKQGNRRFNNNKHQNRPYRNNNDNRKPYHGNRKPHTEGFIKKDR